MLLVINRKENCSSSTLFHYAELDKRNQRFIDSIVNAIASNPHEEVRCVIGREVHTNYCCHCDKPVVRYLGKENS